MTQQHWAVVNRTYPGGQKSDGTREPQTVTEFEFGNGVSIQYDPECGGMYIYLPVPEAALSVGRETIPVHATGVMVNLDRMDGALTGIEIIRSEQSQADDT
jgi:uncharacterized protein YuzE